MATETAPTAADVDNTFHPFERAGLGKAPFSFVSVTERDSSCDYCGTAIHYNYHIKSADGRRFTVGCDCVHKLGRADNRLVATVERARLALERKIRREKAEATKTREAARIAAVIAALNTTPALEAALAAQPHPTFADSTLLNWVAWMLNNAGHSGKVQVARVVEKALAGLTQKTDPEPPSGGATSRKPRRPSTGPP